MHLVYVPVARVFGANILGRIMNWIAFATYILFEIEKPTCWVVYGGHKWLHISELPPERFNTIWPMSMTFNTHSLRSLILDSE